MKPHATLAFLRKQVSVSYCMGSGLETGGDGLKLGERGKRRERIRLSIWMVSSMKSLRFLPSSRHASSACNSIFSPRRKSSLRVCSTQVVCAAIVRKARAYSAAVVLPWLSARSCSPAPLPPAGLSNTSLKRCRKKSMEGNADPSPRQTAVTQSRALPVSSEQTNVILLASLGYKAGCWVTNSEHWRRNPLHIVESPLNLSGKARRGLTGGGGWFGMFKGISSWVAAGAGGDKLSPCRDRTNSSVSAVKWVSWCWWMASWLACAESSDVSCVRAAGSLCGEVFCDETEAWGSICSLLTTANNTEHK